MSTHARRSVTAPGYYLGRPAAFWLAALAPRRPVPLRATHAAVDRNAASNSSSQNG